MISKTLMLKICFILNLINVIIDYPFKKIISFVLGILLIILYYYSNKNDNEDINLNINDNYYRLYYYNNDGYKYIKPCSPSLWSTEKTILDDNKKQNLTCKNLEEIIQREGKNYRDNPDYNYTLSTMNDPDGSYIY